MKLAPGVWVLRGATMFECQIGRIWVTLLRPRFWGCGPLIRVRIAEKEGK